MNKIDKINEWIWNVGILKELFDNRTFKKMKILTCKVELRRWHVGEKRKNKNKKPSWSLLNHATD